MCDAEIRDGVRIESLAGEDVDVCDPKQIKAVNGYVAGQDKLNGRSPLGAGVDLALLWRQAFVIPEVEVLALHLQNVVAEGLKETPNAAPGESCGVAVMEVKDEFHAVGFGQR